MAKRAASRDPTPKHDDEDLAAFRAAVSDVTPLGAPSMDHLAKPRRRRRPAAAVAAAALTDLDAPGAGDSAAAAITRESLLSFRRPSLRPDVMRRLRRGLFPVDDELDLHGQSESVARDRLALFLAQGRERSYRCVRIVHGKGHRSGPQGPVLKSAVNAWLRRHLDVLAFTSARPIDGGAGALYVLLRW